ncbi:MAG: PAS domain-containing protein [Dongiaceae bacterium]
MVNQIYKLDSSRIDSPRIHRFRDYWRAKRPTPDAIPLRADFDPAELRELLPNILIAEVQRDPLGFRDRLVGTRIVEFNNLYFTGLYLGTIGWQEEQKLIDAFADFAASGAPLCGFCTWTLKSGGIGKCEFGVFSLATIGGR